MAVFQGPFRSLALILVFMTAVGVSKIANLPDLRFANGKDIRRIRTSDQVTEPIIQHFEKVEVLDFDIENDFMYWTDIKLKKIYRAFANGTDVVEIVPWGLGDPKGLAIDWVGHHIIWCDRDPRYQHVHSFNGSRMWIAPYDAAYRRILVWRDLDSPRAVVLDAVHGHIYWADWGRLKIERCRMDGTERTVIIDKNLKAPNGLTIDYKEGRLYWTDSLRHSIEYANLDGSNRTVLLKNETILPYPFAITLLDDYLYWTDIHRRAIFASTKFHGIEQSIVENRLLDPYDIRTFDIKRQSPMSGGPCADQNGGCSHFCLYVPPGRVCACPTGVKLLKDGKTCASGIAKFLLFTRLEDLRMYSIDADSVDVLLHLEVTGTNSATNIDYDVSSGYVYWAELVGFSESMIKRGKLAGSSEEIVVPVQAGAFDKIAVDQQGGNIFWSNGHFNSIMVARMDGSGQKTVIQGDGLSKPRGLAIDPVEGYMYWSAWGDYPHIGKACMDGSNRTVLFDQKITWPNGLTIDYEARALYWADALRDVIESSDLWGGGRRIVVSSGTRHIYGLTLLGRYLYWIDSDRKTIERADKITGKRRAILVNEIYGAGVRAIDTTANIISNNCSNNNGGCSHICLARPSGRTCACPDDFIFTDSAQTQCKAPVPFLVTILNSSGFTSDYVRRISLTQGLSTQHIFLQPNNLIFNPVAIDVDWPGRKIYCSDQHRHTIVSLDLDGSNVEVVIDFEAANQGGLAVDWMARNMYWTVEGQDRIDVARLDGSLRTVFLYENIKKPMAIAVEPAEGMLYFSTWDAKPAIHAVNVTDPSTRVILTSLIGHSRPTALTIDYETRRLFWADPPDYTITVIDLVTKSIASVVNSPGEAPFGLAFYSGRLYWSNELATEIRYGPSTGLETIESKRLMGMSAFANEDRVMLTAVGYTRQPGENKCSVENGGCEWFCLSQSRHASNCSCPIYLERRKEPDTTLCVPPPTALLYATDTDSLFHFGKPTSIDVAKDMLLPSGTVDPPLPVRLDTVHIRAVDMNMDTEMVFWVDDQTGRVLTSTLGGRSRRILLSDASVYDICVNEVTGHVYYTNTIDETIGIIRPDGSAVGLIVNEHQLRPRSLAIDPHSGHVYWTDWGTSVTVRQAKLDGTQQRTLISTNLHLPTGLTISLGEHLLYWVDPERGVVERCDVAGKNRLVYRISSTGFYSRVGLGLAGDFVFFVDPKAGLMKKFPKKAGVQEAADDQVQTVKSYLVRTGLENVTDFVVFQDIPSPDNPCAHNNGNCSHICIAVAGTYCSCPLYRALSGNTCSNPVCPKQYVPCRDNSYCIPSTMRCDGRYNCLDGSDEIDGCLCKADEFTCRSGDCIQNLLRCNGKSDCLDESDEDDCPKCRKGLRLCPDRRCINAELFCDGLIDCAHGADESESVCSTMSPNTTVVPVTVMAKKDNSLPKLTTIILCAMFGVLLPFLGLVAALAWRRWQSKSFDLAESPNNFEMNNQRRCRTESSTYNDSIPTTECSQLTKAHLEELEEEQQQRPYRHYRHDGHDGRRSPSVAGISEYVLGLRSRPCMPSMSSLHGTHTDNFTLDPPMGGPPTIKSESLPPNPPPSEFTVQKTEKSFCASSRFTTDDDDDFVLSSSEDEVGDDGARRRDHVMETVIDSVPEIDRAGGVSVVSVATCPPPPPSIVTEVMQTAV
eukprot:m.255045 g.255045  ORF g.255045 m.255045 type:complete len:1679 (+) comp40390_c1_seq5:372-5408(+)